MPKTLLQKAKEINVQRQTTLAITNELIELVLAWMKDEIKATQAAKIMYGDRKANALSGLFHARAAVILREAYRKGKIKIV